MMVFSCPLALLTETMPRGPDLVVGRVGGGVPCLAPVVGVVVVRVGGGYPALPSVVGSLLFSSCKKRNFVAVFVSFFLELESIET